MDGIDSVSIEFGEPARILLGAIAFVIIFGISLQLKTTDLARVSRRPRAVLIVLIAQFVATPLLSLAIIRFLDVPTSVALGMILIACCPPGKLSNILTQRAGGDVPLSVTMTLVSNFVALAAVPLAFPIWAGLETGTASVLRDATFSTGSLAIEVALVVALPIVLGMLIAAHWPGPSRQWSGRLATVGFIALLALTAVSLVANWSAFEPHLSTIVVLVLIQNSAGFALGYLSAALGRVPLEGRKAITFEVGVRNAGVGLLLALTLFHDLGGMALIVAWWAVWDVVAGIGLAELWARARFRRPRDVS